MSGPQSRQPAAGVGAAPRGVRVGIFFKVDDDWVIDAVAPGDGEAYGEAVQHGGHFEHWEAVNPATALLRRFKGRDYDFYPRGRVVWFPRRGVFRVYVDNCLTPADLRKVLDLFGLTGQTHEFQDNDDGIHYVCAGCGDAYLE